MGSCLCLILRCSVSIIFLLLRYVATIAMKAFYDEALLKIAFNFSWYQSTELQCSCSRGTHREYSYSSKQLKNSIVERILVFKTEVDIGTFLSPKNFSSVRISQLKV